MNCEKFFWPVEISDPSLPSYPNLELSIHRIGDRYHRYYYVGHINHRQRALLQF
jgi:hypothetical protein